MYVGGTEQGDLRYADDAAMISKSRSGLRSFVAEMNVRSNAYGLKMNAAKTKVMAVVKDDSGNDDGRVSVNGITLEEVDHFKYLGARIQKDGDKSKEIKSRLAIRLKALNDVKKLWQGQDKKVKLRVLRACIFPIATYACEAWVLRKADEQRITAFENKCYRRILRVPWVERRTNEDIRNVLNVSKDWLLQYVRKQKLGYFGHIVRHDGLEKRVLEAYIPGKRSRGRPRCRWDETVKETFGSMEKATRMAQNRQVFHAAVREATL